MTDLISTFDQHFGVFIILTGVVMVVVITVIKSVVTVSTTASRERSRREIAAYIAEGTMTPDQGERLLKASVNGKEEVA